MPIIAWIVKFAAIMVHNSGNLLCLMRFYSVIEKCCVIFVSCYILVRMLLVCLKFVLMMDDVLDKLL